jgi:hypothetical protein
MGIFFRWSDSFKKLKLGFLITISKQINKPQELLFVFCIRLCPISHKNTKHKPDNNVFDRDCWLLFGTSAGN